MWGFKLYLDRNLAKQIFNMIVSRNISENYKTADTRGYDQFFLRDKVYNLIKSRSLIQDSYTCSMFNDSISFPTKRLGNCFIGRKGECDPTNNEFFECPIHCRSESHLDWKKC